MKEKGLVDFFEKYLEKTPIFKNKIAVQANYDPDVILHRDEQRQQLANILGPALRIEKPSNVFLYGKTGTGKTLVAKKTTQDLSIVAKQKKIPLDVIYLNCKLKRMADTEYRLIAQILREYHKSVPTTGMPTNDLYQSLYKTLDSEKRILILILDEIDQLVGKIGDELLYNLTRINSELKHSQLALIGISNNTNFIETLDPRVKSSLNEENLVFPPYDAEQIKDILRQRAKLALMPGVIEDGVIEKCAALTAGEHGDVRRALDLLRVAGELAERQNDSKITLSYLDQAEEKIERESILDLVATQPKQYQVTLFSILSACDEKQGVFTGEIYSLYERCCSQTGLRPLTQRRVSDIIAELDMLGIINAKVISKGRYGRTREISIGTNDGITQKIKGILNEELGLSWSR